MSDFEIWKALAFIDEHIEDKLLLNDIANDLGYSPFYVSRNAEWVLLKNKCIFVTK